MIDLNTLLSGATPGGTWVAGQHLGNCNIVDNNPSDLNLTGSVINTPEGNCSPHGVYYYTYTLNDPCTNSTLCQSVSITVNQSATGNIPEYPYYICRSDSGNVIMDVNGNIVSSLELDIDDYFVDCNADPITTTGYSWSLDGQLNVNSNLIYNLPSTFPNPTQELCLNGAFSFDPTNECDFTELFEIPVSPLIDTTVNDDVFCIPANGYTMLQGDLESYFSNPTPVTSQCGSSGFFIQKMGVKCTNTVNTTLFNNLPVNQNCSNYIYEGPLQLDVNLYGHGVSVVDIENEITYLFSDSTSCAPVITDTYTLTFLEEPVLEIPITPIEICQGDTYTLQMQDVFSNYYTQTPGINTVSFVWTPLPNLNTAVGNSTSSGFVGLNNTDYIINTGTLPAGNYFLQLDIVNKIGAVECLATINVPIEILSCNPCINSNLNVISDNINQCDDETIQITGGVAPYDISWTTTGSLTITQSGGNNNIINSSMEPSNVSGTYEVTVEDADGCIATASFPYTSCSIIKGIIDQFIITDDGCFDINDQSNNDSPIFEIKTGRDCSNPTYTQTRELLLTNTTYTDYELRSLTQTVTSTTSVATICTNDYSTWLTFLTNSDRPKLEATNTFTLNSYINGVLVDTVILSNIVMPAC